MQDWSAVMFTFSMSENSCVTSYKLQVSGRLKSFFHFLRVQLISLVKLSIPDIALRSQRKRKNILRRVNYESGKPPCLNYDYMTIYCTP